MCTSKVGTYTYVIFVLLDVAACKFDETRIVTSL